MPNPSHREESCSGPIVPLMTVQVAASVALPQTAMVQIEKTT